MLLMTWALLLAVATHAQEEPDPDPAEAVTRDDIERTIATLEDPEARAALVQDLRVLLEQQAAEERPAARPRDLLESTRDLVIGAWDAITSVDPRQVVISTLVSLGIVLAALALRWLLLRLLRRFYHRLTPTAEELETPEAAQAPQDPRALRDAQALQSGIVPAEAQPPSSHVAAIEPPHTVIRLINLIVAVLAVVLIAETWGAGMGELLQTDLGGRMAEAALSIVVILIVTAVLWNVSGLVVTRLLTLATHKEDAGRMARRLDTLVPLLRRALQITIGMLSGLLILSELGINIGPLLAGAGILGLAVGFGAQTLVKDLITGVTILLEDGATVGDVVEVAGHAGVVEEMRLRIIQLRDLSGHVHLIPYSEVTTVINMTKDFSFYLMDIGVAYRENTDEVFEVITEVCDRMRSEDRWRHHIHAPLEILGVNRFADSAVEIRARIRTSPGEQWSVGREFNRRMKMAFDERGIEIPFPHTTLYFGAPKDGKPPPAHVALQPPREQATT